MKIIADLHVHSKYSRATSPSTDLENLDKWAQIKGINVLGTGDFTHPQWFSQLKEKLKPAEPGLFTLAGSLTSTRFLLSSEISCIYSKNNKTRKIHLIILSPSLEIVEKINNQLGSIGNIKSDGRPILGLDAKELAKIILNISPDCLIVPAHCLLPDTYLHSNSGIKMIKDISVGDYVYTHEGRLKKVEEIYTRFYRGNVHNIKPYYFRTGLKTTPEHPFYVIKTHKYCPTMGCKTICKKDCASIKRKSCPHKYFEKHQPQWVQAKNLEKGDIFIFPRFNKKIKDIKEIKLNKYLNRGEYKLKGSLIKPNGTRANLSPNTVKINKDFCRLVGYYVSEGYTDNRDSISFCFNKEERKYVKDLKYLMEKIFGFSSPRIYKRKNIGGIEIIYFSKILAKVFSKLFYNSPTTRRAHTKCLPAWILNLPLEKQVEVLRGWWRGDDGATSSRELMNQMKIILLRLGIIPSINEQTQENFNEKYVHKLGNRIIKARHSQFILYNLSFFEDSFKLLKTPEFKKFKTKLIRRHGWIDKKYIYIPVRDIEIKNYKGNVYNLEVADDNSYVTEFATVHNCWTPWFSLFGSKSGFDSMEECFEEYSKYIFAVETGLSSNPQMNWRLSALDKVSLISNSDAHSPAKIGREANVFNTDLNYFSIIDAIKSKDSNKFLYTIEFFPEEGKYHYDGHRLCNVSFSPEETRKHKNICPVCKKPLTIGVLNRVEELADRSIDFKPAQAIPFKSLISLEEIIMESLGVKSATKEAAKQYQSLINHFQNELEILLNVSKTDLEKISLPEIIEGIMRVREGRVLIKPGYDGVFGKIKIFSQSERKNTPGQPALF